MARTESDIWFHIAQERKRDQRKLVERAQRRHEKRRQRTKEEYANERIVNSVNSAKMSISDWYYDEYGNLCRILMGE